MATHSSVLAWRIPGPIARPAVDKNPMPGHPLEGNPVGEGTTRKGAATPVHRPQRPAGSNKSNHCALYIEEYTVYNWAGCMISGLDGALLRTPDPL